MKHLLAFAALACALLLRAEPAPYKIVDLSAGSDAATYPVRDSNDPPDVNADTCRTTELWLRYAPPGTFKMGSPDAEAGRQINEELHDVTLTSGFYIGVFEVTQRQWELIMGKNPSQFDGPTRPVDNVNYENVRGNAEISGWPTHDTVEAGCFIDRLRKRTSLHFDLPSEAQWEYACRAGTTTALNTGDDLTVPEGDDPAMNAAGRYRFDIPDKRGGFEQHTRVGSYDPNPWGLYDMHGNVAEWCKDSYSVYPYDRHAVTDPIGGGEGVFRLLRGGGWMSYPRYCRSAKRESIPCRVASPYYGLRLVHNITPPAPLPPTKEEAAKETPEAKSE